MEGHLGSVTVNVPWTKLMTEDGYVEITHLYLAVKPRPLKATDGKSVLECMFSSMSSSMQLAQDCMEREHLTQASVQAAAMEGLGQFAMTIDNSAWFENKSHCLHFHSLPSLLQCSTASRRSCTTPSCA